MKKSILSIILVAASSFSFAATPDSLRKDLEDYDYLVNFVENNYSPFDAIMQKGYKREYKSMKKQIRAQLSKGESDLGKAASDYAMWFYRQFDRHIGVMTEAFGMAQGNNINEAFLKMDSTLAHLKKTYTLVDPHAKEMQFGRDGRSFYFPLDSIFLPYWEANGLNNGEVYEMTKSFAKAQAMGETMNNAEVQLDSVILSVHPLFQPVLLALNDSTRVLAERLQREAKNRIMKAPDVPADQLLQAIVKEYPGKVVFFDLWATWCGPCKKGIEAMEPLKEELKEEDVVFVYLTDGSSPTSAWNDYVLKVPGKHYRIDSLSKIPGLTGIPQYYLYDRQGKQVWEQSGFSDEVLKDIEAQITKLIK